MNYEVDIRSSLFDKDNGDNPMVIPLDGGGQEPAELNAEENRFYGFHLGNIGLLLDKEVHRELLDDAVVVPIPLMPQVILGLCNVRGNLIPVLNLHQTFGFEVNNLDLNKVRVLVLGDDDGMVGIVMQEMLKLWQFDDFDRVEDVPVIHKIMDDHVTFCYQKDGSYWYGFNYISLVQSVLENTY